MRISNRLYFCASIALMTWGWPLVLSSKANTIYTPSQIRAAYGFNGISFKGTPADGSGQTIAIVDVGSHANISTDLASFDSRYSIAAPPSFSIVNQSGGTTLPAANSGWDIETDIDVEWAHAIAPAANIVLVETSTNSWANLYAGAHTAANAPGVSAVSMSWGNTEYSGELANDANLVTPAGHSGVTFVACSGDSADMWHPALAPTVVGVGGTSLTLKTGGGYGSETVWNDSTGSGGGGVSTMEKEPAYQRVAQNTGYRAGPDVAYNAAGSTDYDTIVNGALYNCYGTSCGAPQWAALIAIANQGRALNNLAPLDSSDETVGTLPMLYNLYNTPYYSDAFHDITTGENTNGVAAGTGFDDATGLGTPQADFLIPYLAGDITVPEPTIAMATFVLSIGWLSRRHPRKRSARHVAS